MQVKIKVEPGSRDISRSTIQGNNRTMPVVQCWLSGLAAHLHMPGNHENLVSGADEWSDQDRRRHNLSGDGRYET